MKTEIAVIAELREAVERLQKGTRDPGAMRKAAEKMDAEREELRRRVGVLDIAVALIRESRDE